MILGAPVYAVRVRSWITLGTGQSAQFWHSLNTQIAIVRHPREHLTHRIGRVYGMQTTGPAQITGLRIDFRQRRQLTDFAVRLNFAQASQFAQDANRIISREKETAMRFEFDAIGYCLPNGRFRFG